MPEREYKRLTRGGRHTKVAFVSSVSSSLWLGKDHLLLVESNGYSEKYKRFYFKDIQALIIRKTRVGIIRAIVLGVIAFFFALLAIATRDEVVGLSIMGSIAFLLAVIGVSDVLFGPTASCSLRTAVQVEQLPSLNRARRAQKVLELLKPLITAAQGSMSPQEVAAQMQARPAGPMAAAAGEIPPMISP